MNTTLPTTAAKTGAALLLAALALFAPLPAVGVEGSAAAGSVFVEVTDVLKRNLPGKIELVPAGGGTPIPYRLKEGKVTANCAPGHYVAYIYVYDWDIPILVDMHEVTVQANEVATVLIELVEGSGGSLPLRAFDRDFDLVLDRVEIAAGTHPGDPDSFPLADMIPYDSPVLSKDAGWYKGDLHVRSIHGGGKESVAELVARAEKAGLDFIAITDRNTMDACFDPGFQSKKVVLIPAMEWGTDERGVALIYGPHTFPRLTNDIRDDQGICQRVQAQGGIFAIAHPCFPTAPWQRGLSYVNAIEVWCRGFRDIPPVGLGSFVPEYQRRVKDKLVYSISKAASVATSSANAQACMFWDYESVQGLKACPIAGSLSSGPDVPLGRPLTWIYAPEKSVRGIVHGLRLGRTQVSSGPDGPFITFTADAKEPQDQYIVDKQAKLTVGHQDVGIGGVVPLGMAVDLLVQVQNAKGLKVEILRNGWPILTQKIETNKVDVYRITDTPSAYSVYRARVVGTPDEKGYGPLDVKAMTGAIYAQDIVPIVVDKENPLDIWIKLDEDSQLPGVKATATMEENGKKWVRTQGGPVNPVNEQQFNVPPNAEVKTLNPQGL